MRNPFAIIIFLLWLLLGWWYYKSYMSCCKNSGDVSNTSPLDKDTIAIDDGPLMFNYSDHKPITKSDWEAVRKSLLDRNTENKILELFCRYRTEETNKTKLKDLGLARAEEVRKLFPELKDNQIRMLSDVMTKSIDPTKPFTACDFDWRVNTENVKEIANKTLIYFPFNSTQEINKKDVENYLNDAATRVLKSGETITLTGHTDNIGSEAPNVALGQKRADIIRKYLLNRKVPDKQIKSSSKGEAEPIADNTTEDGRSKNRRTELQIIK